ncbi:MAG TPA: tRNA (adenosine(37)-N6)-dimethylallyltransferase MiaA [Candidatus Acidoferrum sp.]|nr:tRNA (adenosine(37)-N6)-dimethylallyltransferase MiaA [Candidatus Acidoferrum sp.]
MARAVIVGGPTAGGKSALALAVAREFGGAVINADSLQVYRELPVLTAQPTAAACAAAPHRLYGFLPATERSSAARWAASARAEIDAAAAQGRLPIVVGGTGLYLRALQHGLAPVPEIPAAVRSAAKERLVTLGKAAFHAELVRRDPAMAARVQPSDAQRMVRAWEVLEATGRSLADWQARQEGPIDGPRFLTFVLMPERAALYAACDTRFRAMVEQGALGEAAALRDLDPGLPAFKALGLRELIAHLRGESTLEAAIAAAQQATRRYAKRQMTWFRNQMPEGRQIVPGGLGEQLSERIFPEIYNFIRNSG